MLDASLVDRGEVETRSRVVAALADLDPRVCRPLALGSRLVVEVDLGTDHVGLLTRYEYAHGTAPDPADATDAARMGGALAELHHSLSRLPWAPLPPVAPLRAAGHVVHDSDQLLHGDFASGNLRQLDGAVRIFDFDDCGYGPPTFEVANALYMALFDGFVRGDPGSYRPFKERFVGGYCAAAGHDVDDTGLDRYVGVRTSVLARWLEDLSTAPIGIRTATPTWHALLRSFVDAFAVRPVDGEPLLP